MVNYRRVVCEVALLCVLVSTTSAAYLKHYDQRQNGTENYRLNIDGVVIAVAPGDSLFSMLGGMEDFMDLLDVSDGFDGDFSKPPSSQGSSSQSPLLEIVPVSIGGDKPVPKPSEGKPTEDKPAAEVMPAVEKPQEEKPVVPAQPAEPAPLSDVSMGDDLKSQKKEASTKKQEKAKRLKNRLTAFLLPLLRKTRHH